MGGSRLALVLVVGAVVIGASGCTDDRDQAAPGEITTTRPARDPPTVSTSPSTSAAPGTSDPPTTSSSPPPPGPPRFRTRAAVATVGHLAGGIGPRLATDPAFDRAARWVAGRFAAYGYDVSRQQVPVPAGDSWGIPVQAGTSSNVIAAPEGIDLTRPWRLVGAHLDTVAVAPGAEDNASGVAVLLELARLAAGRPTALPTVFVAFGGEEPRGEGDALHHFGSMLHMRRLPDARLASLRSMVSLDRVGIGAAGVVPVCTGGLSPVRVRDELAASARRLGIASSTCSDNTASDHWSYEKAGVTVARVGGTSYAAYHSASDVPAVVQPAQLGRVGRILWAWLRS